MERNALASGRVARRPNKPKGKAPIRVNYVLPAELIGRVDRYAAKLEAEQGRACTRTDALRLLITDALERAGIK
jgi:hypothetical protein